MRRLKAMPSMAPNDPDNHLHEGCDKKVQTKTNKHDENKKMTNSENHPAFFSFPRYDEHKPQSVSNWERGETVPDPDTLAEIFDGSVEALIHRGHCAGRYRRRATVARMGEAIGCIHRMHDLMGDGQLPVPDDGFRAG